jgi:hypothetical protein
VRQWGSSTLPHIFVLLKETMLQLSMGAAEAALWSDL